MVNHPMNQLGMNTQRGNFANPEYFDTDESEENDSLKKNRGEGTRTRLNGKQDYYNEVGLHSDGGSTRGSTTESTSSI